MKKMMFSLVVLTISVCGPLGYAQSKYRSALQKGSVLTALELATSFGSNKESYRFSGNTDSFKSGTPLLPWDQQQACLWLTDLCWGLSWM